MFHMFYYSQSLIFNFEEENNLSCSCRGALTLWAHIPTWLYHKYFSFKKFDGGLNRVDGNPPVSKILILYVTGLLFRFLFLYFMAVLCACAFVCLCVCVCVCIIWVYIYGYFSVSIRKMWNVERVNFNIWY